MGARTTGIALLLSLLTTSQLIVVTHAHGQPATPAFSALCKQQGGRRDCRHAIVGPWQYLVKDLLNDLRFDNEAAAYAYFFEHYERASVFTLVYRWNAGSAGRFATAYVHSIETSAWKVYQRCAYLASEPACDSNPEYVGYQRVRDVGCPPGYRFDSDTTSPYCYAVPATEPATSRMLARTEKR